MKLRKYILLVLLTLVFVVGLFLHFASNPDGGGGGLAVSSPSEIVAGTTVEITVEASVWGGNRSVMDRYTDVHLGYRLNSEGPYTVVSNAEKKIPDGHQSKNNTDPVWWSDRLLYTFVIPPYPETASGTLEYYISATLDGQQSQSTGTIPVVSRRISGREYSAEAIASLPVLGHSYSNDEIGLSFDYPDAWRLDESINAETSQRSIYLIPSGKSIESGLKLQIDYDQLRDGQTIHDLYKNESPSKYYFEDYEIIDVWETTINTRETLAFATPDMYWYQTQLIDDGLLTITYQKSDLDIVMEEVISTFKISNN